MIPIIYVKVGYLFDACKIYGAILFVISSFLLTVCCPYRLGTPIMMPQSLGRAHYFDFYSRLPCSRQPRRGGGSHVVPEAAMSRLRQPCRA